MAKNKLKVERIRATSRASVKVGDSFYTVEYCEERMLPNNDMDITEEEMQNERKMLWDKVNAECDEQIEDILKTFKKK